MEDPPSPSSLIHSPPPPPRSNLPMLYYGLVVVGTAAIVLVLYNLFIVKWCTDFTNYRAHQRTTHRQGLTSSWRAHNRNMNFISSFKYTKDGGGDSECCVCLSVLEEGEEVRQLPKCKHSFHAPCIDMWLYSHLDCPLCRSPVMPPGLRRHAQSEHSREVFIGPAIFV